MDYMGSQLLAALGLFVLLLIFNLFKILHSNSQKKLGQSAPEPLGALPIIGHLHFFRDHIPVCRILGSLADKYGPIFSIRVGMRHTLVVSSCEAVKECFKTNDKVFAKRPDYTAGKHVGYDCASFGFANGPYWREIRKLVVHELLSNQRLDALKHVRTSEINSSIKELYEALQENQGKTVVMSELFEHLSLNIIMRMTVGKRCCSSSNGPEDVEAEALMKVIKEFMHVLGQTNLSDSIPFPPLRWLDFQGHIKSMKIISEELALIVGAWINEHVQERSKNIDRVEQDFVDVMLSKIHGHEFKKFGHTSEKVILGTITNVIAAGADTTSIHLTWLLSLLLNHRQVMRRAQEEIDEKVGKERWVEGSDISNLNYLQAVVKEALRLFPPAPLAVPHEATEDCRISGYMVRKGTQLLVNVWKLHRDPSVWSEPDEFIPDRFLTRHGEVGVRGQCFEFIPFGSGRRICPGITFAMQVTHLTLARLLQGFDFSTPSDIPVDMFEGLGSLMPKANPVEVLMKPRLAPLLYKELYNA